MNWNTVEESGALLVGDGREIIAAKLEEVLCASSSGNCAKADIDVEVSCKVELDERIGAGG